MSPVNLNDKNNQPNKTAKRLLNLMVSKKKRQASIQLSKRAIKIVLTVIRWIFEAFLALAPFLVPAIIILVAASLVVNMIVGKLGDKLKIYSRECPELVHYYLQDNYQEFEKVVLETTKTQEFRTWIANKQFDLGYDSLIFSGDYTEAQKKGIIKSKNPLAKQKNGKITVRTLTEDINETVKNEGKGVLKNIKVNDEFLAGYKCFELKHTYEAKLKDWYPLAMGGIKYFDVKDKHNKSYLEALNKKASDNKADRKWLKTFKSLHLDGLNFGAAAIDKLVGYTGVENNECIKFENAYPFSKFIDEKVADNDRLYGKNTNTILLSGEYGELKKVDKNIIKKLKKRRIETSNEQIDKWIENCAIIIANDLYYEYASIKEVQDMFLPKDTSNMDSEALKKLKKKRLEFLERSFEAMAKGDSFEYSFVDTYDVCAGKLINHDTLQEAGEVDIKGAKKVKVNNTGEDTGSSTISGGGLHTLDSAYNFTATVVGKNNKKESKSYTIRRVDRANTKDKDCDKIIIGYNPKGWKKGLNKSFNFYQDYIRQRAWSTKDVEKYAYENKNDSFGAYNYVQVEIDSSDKSYKKILDNFNPKGLTKILKNLKVSKGKVIHGIGTNDTNFIDKEREYSFDKSSKSIYYYLSDGAIVDQTHKKITFDYKTDTAFGWTKSTTKSSNGKTEKILYNISLEIPDISKYKRGYRVLNGFEDPQSVIEACRLYSQFEKNNGDLSKVDVDWSHIFEGAEDPHEDKSVVSENDLYDATIKVILHNETGSNSFEQGYRDANMGCKGEGFTFGAMQNHKGHAHNCMKYICNENKTMAKRILGDSLFKSVYSNTEWTGFSPVNGSNIGTVKKLLKTKASLNGQKKYAYSQIDGYMKLAKQKGITNPQLLLYFCDLYHQGPARTLEIVSATISKYGTAEKWNNDTANGLKAFHQSALSNSIMGNYPTRRKYTYEQAKKLSSSIDDYSSSTSTKAKGFPLDPNSGWVITSNYGDSDGRSKPHNGIDLAAPAGTKIYSVTDGKVIFAGEGTSGSGYNNYGKVVAVKMKNGDVVLYAHMRSMPAVSKGDSVKVGQLLGGVGSTGFSTGNHLHFELRKGGVLFDTLNPKHLIKWDAGKPSKKKKK